MKKRSEMTLREWVKKKVEDKKLIDLYLSDKISLDVLTNRGIRFVQPI